MAPGPFNKKEWYKTAKYGDMTLAIVMLCALICIACSV